MGAFRIAAKQHYPWPTTLLISSMAPGGSSRTFRAPIQSSDGKILGAVLVFRDITLKRRMEEEILKSQKIEPVGVLAGGLAHDFNNILTTILGNISLARIFSAEADKTAERLRNAEKACNRAKGPDHAAAHLRQGRHTHQKGRLHPRSAQRDTRVFAQRLEHLPYHRLSAGRLGRGDRHRPDHTGSNNLILNAKQVMPEGGCIDVAVENAQVLRVQRCPCRLENTSDHVQDNGRGIKPGNVGGSEPYFTTKEKGSGLGLAITWSIIKKHDGLTPGGAGA